MPPEPEPVGARPLVEQLRTDIRDDRTRLEARIETVAYLPSLRAMVSTDAETVKELYGRDLKISVGSNEVFQIGQVRGGTVTALYTEGGSLPVTLDAAAIDRGMTFELTDDALVMIAAHTVTPSYGPAGLAGYVAVTRTLDLRKVRAKLADDGVSIQLRDGRPPTDGDPIAETILLSPQASLVLAAPVPRDRAKWPIAVGSAGLCALGIGVSALAKRRGAA